MSDTTHAFYERLATRGYEPLLHSVSGTIRCDIQDVGSRFVTMNTGSLIVNRDTTGADCMFVCSQEDFDSWANSNYSTSRDAGDVSMLSDGGGLTQRSEETA